MKKHPDPWCDGVWILDSTVEMPNQLKGFAYYSNGSFDRLCQLGGENLLRYPTRSDSCKLAGPSELC